jgi:hypothetical protein
MGWCFRSEGFLVLGRLVGLSEAAIWVDWSWCREEGAQAGVSGCAAEGEER